MGWGFHYAGPREPRPDLNCATCLAKAQGKCPSHMHGNDATCAHCQAVHGGECHAHWGLVAALTYYRDVVLPQTVEGDMTAALADFEKASQEALAAELNPKRPNVKVTLRGNAVPGERDLFVEVRSI